MQGIFKLIMNEDNHYSILHKESDRIREILLTQLGIWPSRERNLSPFSL